MSGVQRKEDVAVWYRASRGGRGVHQYCPGKATCFKARKVTHTGHVTFKLRRRSVAASRIYVQAFFDPWVDRLPWPLLSVEQGAELTDLLAPTDQLRTRVRTRCSQFDTAPHLQSNALDLSP